METVATSSFASIAPRISGALSTVCSASIMHIILRSSSRLSSSYHRIMFFMSLSDIIGSTSIALTTLPMPKDDEWVDTYNFSGSRIGNTATCTCQGFAVTFGMYTAYSYQMSLCVFYMCRIGISLKQKHINRFIEPILHLAPLGISLYFAVAHARDGMFNPTPKKAAWCTATVLPYDCEISDDAPACVRGSREGFEKMLKSMSLLTIIIITTMIISLAIVCGKVAYLYMREKKAKKNSNENNQDQSAMNHSYRYARAVFLQASAYVLGINITCLPATIQLFFQQENDLLTKLHLVFFPLQGFFNFLIFVGAKVNYLRITRSELTLWMALQELFLSNEFNDTQEAVVLTGISILDQRRGSASQRESDNNLPSKTHNEEQKRNVVSLEDSSLNESDSQQRNKASVNQPEWDVSWTSRSSFEPQSLNSGGVSHYDGKNLLRKKVGELPTCAEKDVSE